MKIGMLILASLVLLAGCNRNAASTQETQAPETESQVVQEQDQFETVTIVDTLVRQGGFETLLELVTEAQLEAVLRSEGPYTVFAPTDEAFSQLGETQLSQLKENPEELVRVIEYHVLSGNLAAADVSQLETAQTLEGSSVTIGTTEGGQVTVNDATVVESDLQTDNGYIHVIDSVLLPE